MCEHDEMERSALRQAAKHNERAAMKSVEYFVYFILPEFHLTVSTYRKNTVKIGAMWM